MDERTAERLLYVDRIAHNYWTVDYGVVWDVVERAAPQLHQALAKEIDVARSVLDADE